MFKKLLYIIALGLLMITQAFSQAHDPIRFIEEQQVTLSSRQALVLNKLKSEVSTSSTRIFEFIDLNKTKDSEVLSLTLPDVGTVACQLKRSSTISSNQSTWSGSFSNAKGEVFLSITDGNVSGRIRYERLLFTIEPLGNGLHALIKVDAAKIPVDEPANWKPQAQSKQNQIGKHGIENIPYGVQRITTATTIDILVVYTAAVASHSGDVNALVNACIQSTNDVMSNSDATPLVNKIYSAQVSYTESGDVATDNDRLRNTSDGYMDNVHALRDQYGADVVVLLVDFDNYEHAGIAYNIGVGVADAFATVWDSYAVGNYTFAHEVAHLVGARHDNDGAGSYEHGYRYDPAYWRTVMAVFDEYVLRIPYWSNPNKTYGGVAMGTANWNDNTRKWNEEAGTVAAFKAPLAAYITGTGELIWKYYGTWTANPSGGGGSYAYEWRWRDYPSGSFSGVVGTGYQYTKQMPNNSIELQLKVTSGAYNVYDTHIVLLGDGSIAYPSEDVNIVPPSFNITQNFPNPFNPETKISFGLPEPSEVTITISDLLGRKVVELISARFSAGYQSVTWRGTDGSGNKVGSGIYFYRVSAVGESGKGFTKVMKMLLAK